MTKHKCFLTALLLFVLTHANAQELTPSKSQFIPSEKITLSFSEGTGNAKDWVGIYLEGETPGDADSIDWLYVNGTQTATTGKSSGQLVFDALPVGGYEAHLLENDSYNILASTSFVVSEEQANNAPVVIDQLVEVDEDGAATITLTGSDEDGDDLSFTVVSQPMNGTLSGTTPSLTYRPEAGYSGSDSFTFKANDGKADSGAGAVTITVIKKQALPEGVYFEENFDGLTLGAFESDSENDGDGTDWTAQTPAGWVMKKGDNHGPTAGGEAVKEFDGWTFIDPVSWNATAGQLRSEFTKGSGVIAVADSDEYDDKADAALDASLNTPSIDISGAVENTLILIYDSSWRKEPQTGSVTVRYDGGAEIELLKLDGNSPDAMNETVELELNNPAGAKSMVVKWDHQGHNNWWWAIDNISIYEKVVQNIAPVVANQSVGLNEDGTVPITLEGSDEDGDSLSFEVTSQPKNGTLSGVAPALTYRPEGNYSGSDSFTFKANDGSVDSNVATVTISIASVNDKPMVTGQSVEVNEDGAATITLTGSDEDGDDLSFTIVSQPKNGTLSGTTPSLTYRPDGNYSGSDSFTFKANDGSVDSNVATVTISITSVNDKPVVTGQSVEVKEDEAATITLTGSDEDGDNLSFTIVSQPKNGTLSGTAPSLTYRPNAGYSGSDSFTFKANDGSVDSNVATVTISIASVNDKPVVTGQSVEVKEDGAVSITLTGSDEDGDDLSFTVVNQPKNGTLSGTTPSLTYRPNAGYSGSDSFTFKANDGKADSGAGVVTITVIKKSTLPEGVYFEENFDRLTLGAFESDSENDGDGTDWTAQTPAGWVMRKGDNHGPTAGGEAVKEFDGWTFIDPVSWNATAGQLRSEFTKGSGVIAVADSDEYDDKADAALDASLNTPSIDISGAVENTLILKYDSSWRKEPQTGSVTVRYDGGAEIELLKLDGNSPDAMNETVELELNNPAGAKSVVVKWDHQGHNNWWWAIDNIRVYKKMGGDPEPDDNWTILVYGHADHNLGANLIGDLIEMEKVGSGDGLNIVVQTDFNPKAWERGNKYSINWLIKYHNNIPADMKNKVCRILVNGDKNNWTFDSTPIETLPETENMDHPETLSDFINWAIEKYPAKRYGLVLWDHGGQWTGYGGDTQNGTKKDFGFSWSQYGLKTKTVREAILSSFQTTGLDKFDFLSFDTCLMAGVEVLVDMHDLTDVFMACAEIDYGSGWDFGTLNYLKQNPKASTIDFAKQEVADWDKHHSKRGADIELRNHAAFDFSKYENFKTNFIEFARQLTTAGSSNTQVITRVAI